MQIVEAQIQGITRNDIQEIFENTLREFKQCKTRVIYLDASYIYNFDVNDFDVVKKFNLLGRYDPRVAPEWHKCLERFYGDQTVTFGGQVVKPIQIERSFDKIVSEGLMAIAGCLTGDDSMSFEFRGIGEGVDITPVASDQVLGDEIDRINVNTAPDGGSMSRDGSTIYSIGNHKKSIPSASVTECGIFSEQEPADDMMLDHSVFEDPIVHVQDADVIGSTTVIYMCGA